MCQSLYSTIVLMALLSRFQFDGMKYDASVARGDYAYSQMPQESIKTGIIHRNIPASSEDVTLEEWILDNDERVSHQ